MDQGKKIIVIKCGGSTLHSLSQSFFSSLEELQKGGYELVFVHGGGPDINEALEMFQIKPEFRDGLRKTTKEVMETVELILAGKTNRKLTAMLLQNGLQAVGLNGSDGLIQGEVIDEETLGLVGRASSVNPDLLQVLLASGFVPVITPIAAAGSEKLNINADMAAGAVAEALQADMCLFITDVDGVLKDGELLETLTLSESEELIEDGTISGGMKPKVETALSVLKQGAGRVMIASGKKKFYDRGHFIGTVFYPDVSQTREEASL
ncbi:acetylglutamate kinase [Peribacillus sp. SCS-26]|uniref:acetylglutamate kinase n=1 Tax=Paraperibacillus marinus TaxID=3115295 RepID=UPI003905B9F7